LRLSPAGKIGDFLSKSRQLWFIEACAVEQTHFWLHPLYHLFALPVSKTYHLHFKHIYKMAKKKAPPKPTRMFPSLHPDIVLAVSEHVIPPRFNDKNTSQGTSKTYSTFVTGEFRCYDNTCPTRGWKWTSRKVAILIRQYADGSYNAEVFKQRCKQCDKLGILKLDNSSYVERVSYRLLVWKGVRLKRPHYNKKASKPHKTWLCEGCKRGICREADGLGFE